MVLKKIFRPLLRKKHLDEDAMKSSHLQRCLTLFDLVLLGVGNTLGAGVYVVTGEVAKYKAGPAMMLSFLMAAVVAALSALCYAEFGARIPKAGSAYVYCYVSVGEALAFLVGWSIFLQNAIGAASVARSVSAYIDSCFGRTMEAHMRANFPLDAYGLAEYPDFLALAFSLAMAALLAIGVRGSSVVNNVFAGLNLYVIAYVTICGFFQINPDYWRIPYDEVPKGYCENIIGNKTVLQECDVYGDGGFNPYGFTGVMSGAAMCFYGFIGFDVISTASEEAQNPRRNIPLSTILSVIFVFLFYLGVSVVITLMVPYYDLDNETPLPSAFDEVGWWVASYVITFGGICGLITSLFGCMFALPRFLYSMAQDGLVFKSMGYISPRFKTPVVGCFICGILAGIMGMLFNIDALVNIVALGTLFPYALVAACIIFLRYQPDYSSITSATQLFPHAEESHRFSLSEIYRQSFSPIHAEATPLSAKVAKIATCLLGAVFIGFCAIIVFAGDKLLNHEGWAIFTIGLLSIFILLLILIIWRQPQNKTDLVFKVPLVPFIPAASLFVNIYLMVQMDGSTWVTYVAFMIIGVLIYLLYGIWHSKERRQDTAEDEIALKSESTPILAKGKSSAKKPRVTKTAQIVDGIDSAKPFYWEIEVPTSLSDHETTA